MAESGLAVTRVVETKGSRERVKRKRAYLAVAPGLCCVRPDPDDPGGLGAEESETERTGPTQYVLLAIQRGRRLAEKGPYYDSANDPVTAPIGRFAAFGAQ